MPELWNDVSRRLQQLESDAIEDGIEINRDSMNHFKRYIIMNLDMVRPKVTLTPEGNVRAHWYNHKLKTWDKHEFMPDGHVHVTISERV